MKSRALAAGFATLAIISSTAAPAQAQDFLNRILGNIGGGGFVGMPVARNATQQNMLNNWSNRQAQIRAQINANVSAGVISGAHASNLMAQLDHIDAMTNSYFASSRGPTAAQSEQITASLENVASQMNTSIGVGPGYYNNRFLGGWPYFY